MALYRSSLPQLGGEIFLIDGGIETSLIFDQGLDPNNPRLFRKDGKGLTTSKFALKTSNALI